MKVIGPVLVILTAAVGSALAGGDADLWRFVDAATTSVIRVDVAGLKLDGVDRWAARTCRELGGTEEEGKQSAAFAVAYAQNLRNWRQRFLDADVARVYLVAAGTPTDPLSFALVPLAGKADAKKVAAALEGLRQIPAAGFAGNPEALTTRQIGQALVWADAEALPRVEAIKRAPRPDLAAALAEAETLPVAVALAPSAGQRRQLDISFVRTLLGGIELGADAEKVRWVSAGLCLPPEGALRMVIQTDAATAQAVRKRAYQNMTDQLARGPARAAAARFIQIALPAVMGDRLVTSLDAKQLDDLIVQYARAARQEMEPPPMTRPSE